MTDLQELLARRGPLTDTEVLAQLQAGLAPQADASPDAARATHQLLLDYFALDEAADRRGYRYAARKHRATLERLQTLVRAAGQDQVAELLAQLLTHPPQPSGAAQPERPVAADTAPQDTPVGVQQALPGFEPAPPQPAPAPEPAPSADPLAHLWPDADTRVVLSPAAASEMELNLLWDHVEAALLDHISPWAADLAFAWGPEEWARRARVQARAQALAQHSAAQLLQAFFADPAPTLLLNIDAQGNTVEAQDPAAASFQPLAVPVRHCSGPAPLAPATCAWLARYPAAASLYAVYQQVNGALLFCHGEAAYDKAALVLLPDSHWADARAHVLSWVQGIFDGGEPDEPPMPDWVHTVIPFAHIPGDASYWVLPVEGPLAGKVLLSNEDIHTEEWRYDSFDDFIATLRVDCAAILNSGGYVSYRLPQGIGEPLRYRGS